MAYLSQHTVRGAIVIRSGVTLLVLLCVVLASANSAQAAEDSITISGELQDVRITAGLTDRPDVPTGLDADAVEQLLPDSLAEYAAVFCEEEAEHSVNLLFVMAIARQETGSGTMGMGRSRNNLFGNRGKSGYMRFDCFEDSIRYEFDLLERLYIGKGRTTVESISKIYCEPPGPWAAAVTEILGEYVEEAKENQGDENE